MSGFITLGDANVTASKIPRGEALRQVVRFAGEPSFRLYDLAGYEARRANRLDTVGPWSLLLANALAAPVGLKALSKVEEHLDDFAARLAKVDKSSDLHMMDSTGRGSVKNVCRFGVPSAWAAVITKVAHLYRDRAIPILDEKVALAFGERKDRFATVPRRGDSKDRGEIIDEVVDLLADQIRSQILELSELQSEAAHYVPDLSKISILRFCDIIIWTRQDSLSRDNTYWWSKAPSGPVEATPGPRWFKVP